MPPLPAGFDISGKGPGVDYAGIADDLIHQEVVLELKHKP
jgi:hypothetical protein